MPRKTPSAARPAAVTRRSFTTGLGLGLSALVLARPAGALAQQAGAAAQPAATAAPAPAAAAPAGPVWHTGGALIGKPRYGDDFRHFDYVNPDAPKGGLVRLSADGTFDTYNFVIPKGTPAAGLGLIYDTLMTPSLDESSSEYGLLAAALAYPDDYSWVKYRLRPEARWHDGTPVTPEDVVWSFEVLTRNNPQQQYYYRHVTKAEVTGKDEITFTFDQAGNRELPHIVGQVSVFPKHWWEGTDDKGRKRDITAGTLEPPLGSGAYRIGSAVPGRTITYERVADYWGANLPVNIGANNFDAIRYDYFRDDTAELEAFKADQFDWRVESSAKTWATAYDFPAVKDGKVVLELFPTRGSGIMVGFIPNLRRAQFQDPRVRRALNLALNYERMNRILFFGQYQRINSYFYGTELASGGLPQGRELEILTEVRAKAPAGSIPDSVFTTPYTNPVAETPAAERANFEQAMKLLNEAGYVMKGGQLVNAGTGQPFRIEFLLNGPTFERVGLQYKQSLARLGIELTLRTVDSSQYVNRVRAQDFDVIYTGWPQSLSPGNEQRAFFGSDSAGEAGSPNYAGIRNPAVDLLIDRIIYARDRDDLVAATHALDRVLLAEDYVIPGWTLPATRVARWNRFAHPERLPDYADGFPSIWWFDTALAGKIGRIPQ
ncbi:extracellular solute-binding protein [Pseudoxanthobacter sp.]|uniref:extracellular solute-binding protein n=1 Tax=Pseudoxanthobacter sp. TaxID=1925742 RepID=UPI002FE0E08E